jgi:hypothetical protein
MAQGATQALAQLLATPLFDVRVRALMGLGMLLPGREPVQLLLAQQPGAISHLTVRSACRA